MFKRKFHTLICFVFVLLAYNGFSQKVTRPVNKGTLIKIISAESLSFDEKLNDAKVLRGHVKCEHEGAFLYCDTAYIYEKENKMKATGHILITKGDSIQITGDVLFYDGKNRMASLERNVRCTEKDMVLTTQILTFDVANSVANYYQGGTIVNAKNTLTSKNGHYYSATKEATFHFDVELINPEYKMNSDTLKYRLTNKTSYFIGPSIITAKSDYIYCENGWYDTAKENAAFSKNAVLVTSQQKLSGDSLTYDRINKTGRAFRNVRLIDTAQKSVIYGDYVIYREKKSEAYITGKAIYARIMEKDTLFLAADTLYHLDIDSTENMINAYRHVKIFHKQLQGKCDSLTMNTKDSLLQLYYTPLLWTNLAQATAKNIKVEIGKSRINGFYLEGKAFLIQQVDSLSKDKFNQLSGKSIRGILTQDSVRKIIVNGNVDILYYPKNKNKLMGLNNTSCNEIVIWFKNGDVDRVSLKPKTIGVLNPLKQVNIDNTRLKGFNWQYERRPKSRADLHPNLNK